MRDPPDSVHQRSPSRTGRERSFDASAMASMGVARSRSSGWAARTETPRNRPTSSQTASSSSSPAVAPRPHRPAVEHAAEVVERLLVGEIDRVLGGVDQFGLAHERRVQPVDLELRQLGAGGRQPAPDVAADCVMFAMAISTAGEMDCLRFSGTAGTQVTFQVAGGFGPSVIVIRPNGTTACDNEFTFTYTCALDVTGTHTFLIRDESGTGTGSYSVSGTEL